MAGMIDARGPRQTVTSGPTIRAGGRAGAVQAVGYARGDDLPGRSVPARRNDRGAPRLAARSRASHRKVQEAFTHVMGISDVRGALLDVVAPPLPALCLTYGTLADCTPGQTAHRTASASPVHADGGRRELGSLWLDADPARARSPSACSSSPSSRPGPARSCTRTAPGSRRSTRRAGHRRGARRGSRAPADRRPRARPGRRPVRRDRDRRRAGEITRFITSGMTTSSARIGPMPHGRGLLGLIIREDRTYRVPDIRATRSATAFRRTIRRCTRSWACPSRVKVVGRTVPHEQARCRRIQRARPAPRRDVRAPRRHRHRQRPTS